MNEFSMQSGKTPLVLNQALLIYTHANNPIHNNGAAFVTIHDVRDTGTPKRPKQQILPGRPITEDGLLALLATLGDQHSLNTEILPANVLSVSANHLVWWIPAAKRRVFFKTKELGNRAAIVPHPPLLFMVVRNQWYVFSLDKNVRPTSDTDLNHSPYFNVSDNGLICAGTAATPKTISTATIPEWEAAFFDSQFTHVNGSTRKVAHPNGEYAFWKEMLDGTYKKFPMDLLVKTGSTVGQAMVQVRRSLGAHNG